jgi:hypothetical protein
MVALSGWGKIRQTAETLLSGSNSSRRLLGQVGSFSSVSVSQAIGSIPFGRAVSSSDCSAAARRPAASDPAKSQFFFLSQDCDKKNYPRSTIRQAARPTA